MKKVLEEGKKTLVIFVENFHSFYYYKEILLADLAIAYFNYVMLWLSEVCWWLRCRRKQSIKSVSLSFKFVLCFLCTKSDWLRSFLILTHRQTIWLVIASLVFEITYYAFFSEAVTNDKIAMPECSLHASHFMWLVLFWKDDDIRITGKARWRRSLFWFYNCAVVVFLAYYFLTSKLACISYFSPETGKFALLSAV